MATEHSGLSIPLEEFVRKLKLTLAEEGLAEGVKGVLEELRSHLPVRSEKFDTLVILEGSYQEWVQRKVRNVVSAEELNLELNKLSEAILEFVNHLNEEDFSVPEKGTLTPPDARLGKVLYSVPGRMQISEEVECRVWIAFDLKSLEFEIQSVADKELRDVRVSDVMGVELFEHGKNEAFEIVTYDEEIQKIEKGLPTQWTFFVTPLKEGKFPLILKISVVLVDDQGEKISKTVVLREVVQVATTPAEEEVKMLVKEAQQFNFLLVATSGGGGAGTAVKQGGRGSSGLAGWWQGLTATTKTIVKVAAAVLAVLFLWWLFGPFGEKAPSAEQADWETARRSGDTTTLLQFLAAYPEGEFQPDALRLLDHWHDSLAGFSVQLNVEEEPEDTSSMAVGEDAMPSLEKTTPDPPPARTTPENIPSDPGRLATEGSAIPEEREPVSVDTGNEEEETTAPVEPDSLASAPVETEEPDGAIDYKNAASKPLHPDCTRKRADKQAACTEDRIVDTVTAGLKDRMRVEKITGGCKLSFVITKTGVVTGIKVIRADNQVIADAVAEILQELPNFIPGRNEQGENIDVRFSLPVRVK